MNEASIHCDGNQSALKIWQLTGVAARLAGRFARFEFEAPAVFLQAEHIFVGEHTKGGQLPEVPLRILGQNLCGLEPSLILHINHAPIGCIACQSREALRDRLADKTGAY